MRLDEERQEEEKRDVLVNIKECMDGESSGEVLELDSSVASGVKRIEEYFVWLMMIFTVSGMTSYVYGKVGEWIEKKKEEREKRKWMEIVENS